jgi:hypothetical protein
MVLSRPFADDLSKQQCKTWHGKICGQILYVPIVEAPGQMGVGRFGWKDQHASLLSFSGDAYLNEMGITNRLQPNEVTNICNTVSEPNDAIGPDGLPTQSVTSIFRKELRAGGGKQGPEIVSSAGGCLSGLYSAKPVNMWANLTLDGH